MDQWYAICRTATGRLESLGTVVADDNYLESNGLTKIPLASAPDQQHQMWDEASRVFVPRPPKIARDLVEEFVNDGEFPNVNAAVKDKMRQIAQRVFADFRFQ